MNVLRSTFDAHVDAHLFGFSPPAQTRATGEVGSARFPNVLRRPPAPRLVRLLRV
jgi:hypothetical protein